MRFRLALASAVLACGAFVAAQAVAEDQHHDEHHAPPPGGQQHGGPPPGHGPQGHPGGTMSGPPHGTMSGPPHGAMHGGAMMGRGHAPANFDRHAYQRNFVAPRRFHFGVYVRPRGWYEHRWTYGEILPALFWTQNYWLGNYYNYGLADPPPGFVWVRYGSDALLIDQNSGEVLQVEYDVFY
jgi:Ni/Co efflux regulator RcnB